jgi:hypothetical protein
VIHYIFQGEIMGFYSYGMISRTFSLWKKDLGKWGTPSLEAYLIMLVGQLILIPILVILGIVMIVGVIWTSDSAGDSGLLSVFGPLGFMMLIMPVVMLISSFLMAIINPGLVNATYKNFEGIDYRFGDVFRYGKSRYWEFFGLYLINTLLFTFLQMIFIGLIIGTTMLLPSGLEEGICFILIFEMFLYLVFAYTFLGIQYLPFIIRYREGSPMMECIWKSYAMIFRNFGSFLGMGLLLLFIIMLIAIIPFLSIIISLFMPGFMFTLFTVIYEELVHGKRIDEPPRKPQGFDEYSGREGRGQWNNEDGKYLW